MPNIIYDFDMAAFECESAFAQYPIPTAGTGATLAETGFGLLAPGPTNIDIGAVLYHPSSSVPASNSAYSVMSVNKRTGGGGAVLLAQINNSVSVAPFNPGSWAAYVPVSLVLQTGNGSFMSAGDVCTIAVAIGASTGLTFPSGVLGVFAKLR